MKKYLLFVGEEYYPSRGVLDFVATFETLEKAKIAGGRFANEHDLSWGQVAMWMGDRFRILSDCGWWREALGAPFAWQCNDRNDEESSRGQAPDNT